MGGGPGQPGPPLHWFRAQYGTPTPRLPDVALGVVALRRTAADPAPAARRSNPVGGLRARAGGQGHDSEMFANGCDPWYTDNKYAGPPGGTRGTPRRQVHVRAAAQRRDSRAAERQGTPAVRRQGAGLQPARHRRRHRRRDRELPQHLESNSNSCNSKAAQPELLRPRRTRRWASEAARPSPRVVFLFIVPYGAYKNTASQEGLPILNFAAFYVTGWHGQNGNRGRATPVDGSTPTPADRPRGRGGRTRP